MCLCRYLVQSCFIWIWYFVFSLLMIYCSLLSIFFISFGFICFSSKCVISWHPHFSFTIMSVIFSFMFSSSLMICYLFIMAFSMIFSIMFFSYSCFIIIVLFAFLLASFSIIFIVSLISIYASCFSASSLFWSFSFVFFFCSSSCS